MRFFCPRPTYSQMVGHNPDFEGHCEMYTRHSWRFVQSQDLTSAANSYTSSVDGPLGMWFQYVLEITVSMIVKFFAIVLTTPAFLGPSILVAVAGGTIGQIYIKAQLGVKRQMANAKAPVLAQCVCVSRCDIY